MLENSPRGRYLEQTRQTEKEISTERLGNLLAGIGNNEAKALLLIAMEHGNHYSKYELRKLLSFHQAEYDGWQISKTACASYCDHSLIPSDLVERVDLSPDNNSYVYQKTAVGDYLGTPLAGHLLSFSEAQPDFSLRDIFGEASSISPTTESDEGDFKQRAPIRRFLILKALREADFLPLRTTDLAALVGEDERVVAEHLRVLANNGVLEYTYPKQNATISSYSLAANRDSLFEAKAYRTYPELTSEIYTILSQSPDEKFSIEQIKRRLISSVTERGNLKQRYLETVISNILSSLVRQQLVDRGRFTTNIKTEIYLTEDQSVRIDLLITLLQRFQSNDISFLEEGRRLAFQIKHAPERFAALMKKAKESSPYVSRIDYGALEDQILELLEKYGTLDINQIQARLAEEYEMKASKKVLRVGLNNLKEKCRVSAELAGSIYNWTKKE